MSGHTRLRRALGLFETAGVSVAMMAPTAAMALNGALAASYAHGAVPLAFVLAFATIGCVAFAFVTFARVYASPASVGAFNARGLGPFAGRLSGWALLLVYILFTAGSAAEFGAFAAAASAYAGASIGWVPLALVCLAVAAYVGTRPARTSSRAMLVVEGISVAAVVALCVTIVVRGGAHGNALTTFLPRGASPAGIGLATVFALLSFAGFEGAAVLGAESRDPTRTIPRALVASVALAGILYVFVAYAQTIGFGADAAGSAAFAASASPLGDLAARYANASVAALVMAGAAISAFAATLAAATGATRLVFSIANDTILPEPLARVDASSGTPVVAYLTVIAIGTAIVTGFALARASGTDAFAACGTIGVLALLLIYGSVQIAALRLFAGRWSLAQRLVPVIALASLTATFAANVVPIPGGAPAIYSFLVAAWLALGAWVIGRRASHGAAPAWESAEPPGRCVVVERVRSLAAYRRFHDLQVEYEESLAPDLRHGLPELLRLPEIYDEPNAAFLAADRSEAAGCVALTRLDPSNIVLKRLYVRPSFRGRGIARTLVEAATSFSRARGYARIVLDTDRLRLNAAYELYRAIGFSECEPYGDVGYLNPTFMELRLADDGHDV